MSLGHLLQVQETAKVQFLGCVIPPLATGRAYATPESYFHCRHIDTERGPISKWMGGARGRGRRGACANIAEHSLLIHHALSETSPEGHDIIEMREKEGTKKDGEAELKKTEAV